MAWVGTVLTVLAVLTGVLMTFLILLQEGKGGGLAALGGTKAAGVEGVTNPIRRATAYLAAIFFVLLISLAVFNRPTNMNLNFSTANADAKKEESKPAEAVKTDATAPDAVKTDAAKTETPKADAPKTDAPKTDAAKSEAPKTEDAKTEAPKTEAPKTEAPKTEAPKAETPATPAAPKAGEATK
jgi:protein translocase SecG subunit